MLDWGGTTAKGFTAVSTAFLRNYTTMGVSMEEAMLVLHILAYQWDGNLPFPKVETLSRQCGRTEKTVRAYIKSLRDKGLLQTTLRGGRSNSYDFAPLFRKLKEVADLPEAPVEIPEPVEAPEPVAQAVNEKSLLDEMTATLDAPKAGVVRKDRAAWTAKFQAILEALSPELITQRLLPEWRKVFYKMGYEVQAAAEAFSRCAYGGGRETTQILPTQPTPASPSPYKKTQELYEGSNALRALLEKQGVVVPPDAREEGRKPQPPPRKKVRVPKKRRSNSPLQRFLDKPATAYNCNDLEYVIREAWTKKWESASPRFTMRDRKHGKDLIEQYGSADTARVLTEVIEKWDTFCQHLGLNGYPSMPLFYGYRNSLFPMVLDGMPSSPRGQSGTQFNADESRPEGEEAGWGDMI